ncbi:hypothetical protein [Yokenella regensburgei]|uniref:hypothetical protein n=1 Tax=Yokenella regensburgei TaxID=158877 RepID=UPI001432C543|nr:hypothetical protein [Yokenella regensburgei]QIU92566.1 hypothetical protein HEC60_24935 [Yokenella regensburgei]
MKQNNKVFRSICVTCAITFCTCAAATEIDCTISGALGQTTTSKDVIKTNDGTSSRSLLLKMPGIPQLIINGMGDANYYTALRRVIGMNYLTKIRLTAGEPPKTTTMLSGTILPDMYYSINYASGESGTVGPNSNVYETATYNMIGGTRYGLNISSGYYGSPQIKIDPPDPEPYTNAPITMSIETPMIQVIDSYGVIMNSSNTTTHLFATCKTHQEISVTVAPATVQLTDQPGGTSKSAQINLFIASTPSDAQYELTLSSSKITNGRIMVGGHSTTITDESGRIIAPNAPYKSNAHSRTLVITTSAVNGPYGDAQAELNITVSLN